MTALSTSSVLAYMFGGRILTLAVACIAVFFWEVLANDNLDRWQVWCILAAGLILAAVGANMQGIYESRWWWTGFAAAFLLVLIYFVFVCSERVRDLR